MESGKWWHVVLKNVKSWPKRDLYHTCTGIFEYSDGAGQVRPFEKTRVYKFSEMKNLSIPKSDKHTNINTMSNIKFVLQIVEHKSKRNTNTKAQAIRPTNAAFTLVRGRSDSSLLRNARLGYARYCRFSIKHLNHNDSQCLCMTIRFWYPQHQQKPESSILDIFISHIIQVYQSFWWKPRGRAIIFCCWAG